MIRGFVCVFPVRDDLEKVAVIGYIPQGISSRRIGRKGEKAVRLFSPTFCITAKQPVVITWEA
ncbi:MAG: hypothetical protein LBG25_02870 [Spirochaetaceae bacterium]|nr:hypothetical protein [Spirochaetaceae bacterium]